MLFLIGLLTFVMVLDCVVLVALVLIQLPKKDTGGGLAFGGAATDVLFGAGSGTVLTKVTKYAATAFFVLAVVLSILQSSYHYRTTTAFKAKLTAPGKASLPMAPAPAPSSAPAATPTTSATGNVPVVVPPQVEETNLPASQTTPPPAPATPKK